MGHRPDWYDLIKAAQYLGVAPWDLLDQPVVWRDWARSAASAESEARRQRQASSDRKAGGRR